MSQLTCEICGHTWTPIACGKRETPAKLAKKAKQAAVVNGGGPFCELCRSLIMAYRVAKVRGYNLAAAVKIRLDDRKFIERAE